MVNHGYSLAEIAGLDSRQMRWIYWRERDERGQLVRTESAEEKIKSTPVGYEQMFKSVKRYQSRKFKGKRIKGKLFTGWTEADIQRLWLEKLAKTPSLKRWVNIGSEAC